MLNVCIRKIEYYLFGSRKSFKIFVFRKYYNIYIQYNIM